MDHAIAKALRLARRAPAPQSGEPSDDALLRVVDGTASADERREVDDACSRSAFTRDRLAILREAIAESPDAPSILARAATYVMTVARDALGFLRGATAPIAAPAAAWAVRSTSPISPPEPFVEFHHSFADMEAHVRVEHVFAQKTAENTNDKEPAVDVQITLLGSTGRPSSTGRVTIKRAGKTIDSVPTESDGSATFTGLAPDRYELELRSSGQVKGVMVLDFLPA